MKNLIYIMTVAWISFYLPVFAGENIGPNPNGIDVLLTVTPVECSVVKNESNCSLSSSQAIYTHLDYRKVSSDLWVTKTVQKLVVDGRVYFALAVIYAAEKSATGKLQLELYDLPDSQQSLDLLNVGYFDYNIPRVKITESFDFSKGISLKELKSTLTLFKTVGPKTFFIGSDTNFAIKAN